MGLIHTMITFNVETPEECKLSLASRAKDRRLAKNLTQEGLSARSGVPLGTLRKFERTGIISLNSFLKILYCLGDERAVQNLLQEREEFQSLDEVLNVPKKRKRGRSK